MPLEGAEALAAGHLPEPQCTASKTASPIPDRAQRPSGLHDTEVILPVCPSKVRGKCSDGSLKDCARASRR